MFGTAQFACPVHCTQGHRLKNVYDRTSAGVHSDVSQKEAQSLLLNVYLVLGEIIVIPERESEPGV